jgi:hypothetical protein
MDNIRLQQQQNLLKKYLLFEAAIYFSQSKTYAAEINHINSKRELNDINLAINNQQTISNLPQYSQSQDKLISALANENQIKIDLANATNYNKYLVKRSKQIDNVKYKVIEKLKESTNDFEKANKLLSSQHLLENNNDAQQLIKIFASKRDIHIQSNFSASMGIHDIDPNEYASSKLAAKHYSDITLLLVGSNTLKGINKSISSAINYNELHNALINIDKHNLLQGGLLSFVELEKYQQQAKNGMLDGPNQLADLQLDFYSLYKEQDNLKFQINALEKKIKGLTKGEQVEKIKQAQSKLDDNKSKLDSCQKQIDGLKEKTTLEFSPKSLYDIDGNKLDKNQIEKGCYIVPDNCVVKEIDNIVHIIEPTFLNQLTKSSNKQLVIHNEELMLLDNSQNPNVLTKQEKKLAIINADKLIKQSHIGRQAAEGYALGGKALEIANKSHSKSQQENQRNMSQLQYKLIKANKNVKHATQEHDAAIATMTKNLESNLTNTSSVPVLTPKNIPKLIKELKKIKQKLQQDVNKENIYSTEEINRVSTQLRNKMSDLPAEIQSPTLKEYLKLAPAVMHTPLSSLPLGDPNAKENTCFDKTSNNITQQVLLLNIANQIIVDLNREQKPSKIKSDPEQRKNSPFYIPRVPPGFIDK